MSDYFYILTLLVFISRKLSELFVLTMAFFFDPPPRNVDVTYGWFLYKSSPLHLLFLNHSQQL